MTQLYAHRVRRGAELLDRHRPGWEREIDSEDLWMASSEDCILGQIYGGFYAGLRRLSIEAGDAAIDLGFFGSGLGCCGELAAAWRTEIGARLGREGVMP